MVPRPSSTREDGYVVISFGGDQNHRITILHYRFKTLA